VGAVQAAALGWILAWLWATPCARRMIALGQGRVQLACCTGPISCWPRAEPPASGRPPSGRLLLLLLLLLPLVKQGPGPAAHGCAGQAQARSGHKGPAGQAGGEAGRGGAAERKTATCAL
jgi:hypothetical protein